jgi:high affinity Mn2+ porin
MAAKPTAIAAAFRSHRRSFPAGVQRFNSDLAIHSVRAGLNYQFGAAKLDGFTGPSAPEADIWAFHAQTTYLHESAPGFSSPYRDPLSSRIFV